MPQRRGQNRKPYKTRPNARTQLRRFFDFRLHQIGFVSKNPNFSQPWRVSGKIVFACFARDILTPRKVQRSFFGGMSSAGHGKVDARGVSMAIRAPFFYPPPKGGCVSFSRPPQIKTSTLPPKLLFDPQTSRAGLRTHINPTPTH